MNTLSLLKPEHFAPIRNLSLRARLIVEGMIAGMHKSPYHGFSAEFSEYRPYRSGESVRMIDWRKYAKIDRPYVRLFEDETNLFAYLMIDKSASMGFAGDGRMSKFEYARTLAASIAWILIRQRDAVGLAAFDEQIAAFLPPRSTNIQLKNILAVLDRMSPEAQTRCGFSIDRLAQGLRRRGLTVILSDLFDDPRNILQGLRHLRYKRQDVLLIWLIDPQERAFSQNRTYHLRDMESGRTLMLDGKVANRYLHDGLVQHHAIIMRGCRELKVELSVIETDEPFVHALMRVLQSRMRLW